jgi:hypothetical protein
MWGCGKEVMMGKPATWLAEKGLRNFLHDSNRLRFFKPFLDFSSFWLRFKKAEICFSRSIFTYLKLRSEIWLR